LATTEITLAPNTQIIGYKVEYFMHGKMYEVTRDRDGRKLSLSQALWLQKNMRADKPPVVMPIKAGS
jgi:hypothetical protein